MASILFISSSKSFRRFICKIYLSTDKRGVIYFWVFFLQKCIYWMIVWSIAFLLSFHILWKRKRNNKKGNYCHSGRPQDIIFSNTIIITLRYVLPKYFSYLYNPIMVENISGWNFRNENIHSFKTIMVVQIILTNPITISRNTRVEKTKNLKEQMYVSYIWQLFKWNIEL